MSPGGRERGFQCWGRCCSSCVTPSWGLFPRGRRTGQSTSSFCAVCSETFMWAAPGISPAPRLVEGRLRRARGLQGMSLRLRTSGGRCGVKYQLAFWSWEFVESRCSGGTGGVGGSLRKAVLTEERARKFGPCQPGMPQSLNETTLGSLCLCVIFPGTEQYCPPLAVIWTVLSVPGKNTWPPRLQGCYHVRNDAGVVKPVPPQQRDVIL